MPALNHESQSRVQSVTLQKYFEICLPKTRILQNSKILESQSPLFYPYKVKWADIFTTVKDMDMIWISSQNEILYHISYLKISLDIISYQKSLFEILYRIWYEKDMKRYISLPPLEGPTKAVKNITILRVKNRFCILVVTLICQAACIGQLENLDQLADMNIRELWPHPCGLWKKLFVL